MKIAKRDGKEKRFSVLLLYPDYGSGGTETYLAHETAKTVEQAIFMAQTNAARENEFECHEDFLCLAAFSGHRNDLKP